ncbi:MAG: hypothetical protein O3C27_10830 [Actinomycetota bacterium]|nr:hypothetical protein [Actinomycetota bacterium]
MNQATEPRSLFSPARLLRAAKVGVILHLIATAASLAPSDRAVDVGVGINLMLFLVGTGVFVAAFLIAASRSRGEEVWFGGAFLLNGGVVDRRARCTLRTCLGIQVLIGLVGASLKPFSPAAFSVLAPLLGVAVMALFGSRYGRFPSRAS